MRQFIHHSKVWPVFLSSLATSHSASLASPGFEITHTYELPATLYPHTFPWVSALDDGGRAQAVITIEDGSLRYWLASYSVTGSLEWHLDTGPYSQIPAFTPAGATSTGVFYGNWFHGPLPAGAGVTLDAAIATESEGIQLLPRLPDQRAIFLRTASADGSRFGGEIYYQNLCVNGVVYGPDRVPIDTGAFFPRAFTPNGVGYGIDASTGMAATWTLTDGMSALPRPPIEAAESQAFHTSRSGLISVRVTEPEGSGQRYTQLIYDGNDYQILENTADGNTFVRGINDAGWLVGEDLTNSLALTWIDGKVYDLNAIVKNLPPGVTLLNALAINNNGQITVGGFDANFNGVAYLLSPIVPEPSSLNFLVIASALLLRQRRC
jgi:hypothetical protein